MLIQKNSAEFVVFCWRINFCVGHGKVNPNRLIEVQMDLRQAAGLNHPDVPVLAFGSISAPYKAETADALRNLTINNSWPEFLVYMRDEPPAWPPPFRSSNTMPTWSGNGLTMLAP